MKNTSLMYGFIIPVLDNFLNQLATVSLKQEEVCSVFVVDYFLPQTNSLPRALKRVFTAAGR